MDFKLKQFSAAAILLLGACSNTWESTEIASRGGKEYIIKVSEYDSGFYRNADIVINDRIAYRIAPKSLTPPECEKVTQNGFIITCNYETTFEGNPLLIRKVTKSSLLALSINYEIYLDGKLLEVVNVQNR